MPQVKTMMKALLFWLTIDRGGQRARGAAGKAKRAKAEGGTGAGGRGSCSFQMAVTRLHQPTKSSTKTL